MMRLLLLLSVTALAAARAPGFSYPMEASLHDEGRVVMELMKHVKANRHEQRNSDMTCPRQFYESMGPISCENGYAGDFPCSNLDLLSLTDFSDLGYNGMPGDTWYEGNDIWGWTDPENEDEYAIIGLTGGTSFVRINDPTNPVPVAFVYTQTDPSIWRDIKTIGNYAYIVSEADDHGMQVYDLTRLRGRQTLEYDLPDTTYHEVGNVHNIVAHEETEHVYIVGATDTAYPNRCNAGLHMVDVSDPLNPTFAGCYSEDGYTHDAQCVIYHGPDTQHTGREICFAFNENSLTIVDVTDKSNPTMIAKRGYTGVRYSHQGWITEDHTIAFLDDELDEMYSSDKFTKTYIWNIENLDDPILIDTYKNDQTSIDHNMYIIDDIMYQSNYMSGLRVLRIDQENTSNMLEEIAYFDVHPSSTLVDFYGTWSNYPYYKSKTIAVSSIDYGLFLLKLRGDE